MDAPLRLVPAEIVRARIAAVMLGSDQKCTRLGGITLKPHQQSAVARAESSIEEFGGVLLCDEVGMGKTFVATAIARQYSRSLIVAPAALATMWRQALVTTETRADFLTFERLSRAGADFTSGAKYDLVIVDEAHHARNPATRRHRALATLAREARVVLLTATPIHNRTAEMAVALSLFLGSRARNLTPNELARCVLRREHHDLSAGIAIPRIVPAVNRQISDDSRVVQELMSLPPPLPVRDGGLGGALISRGLVHQWASSQAALREAMRKRIARAAALTLSLESGTYPTARELETWTYGDGALQLGFPELLSSPAGDANALLRAVRSHSEALRKLYEEHSADANLDVERGGILAGIRAAHPKARIVAFGQYEATVSMFYSHLSAGGRVAMLSARGGLVAGGKITRNEALARFAPRASGAKPPAAAEEIDLLLTTDILSEGVNLQDAEVVVHLDIPWTAARMEQRVGRVARMGSAHHSVHVYILRPPASASEVLRSELLVQAKWNAAKRAVGSSAEAPFALHAHPGEETSTRDSAPANTEQLRGTLERWRRQQVALQFSDTVCGSVIAPRSGFLAAVSIDDEPLLIASAAGHVSAELDSQLAACVTCEGSDLEAIPAQCELAVRQIHDWFEHSLASASAGIAGSRSHASRKILDRIDSSIQNAPPHVRAARRSVAARARSIATTQHGAAAEADLDSLARSPLPDAEWLEAVASLESARPPRQRPAHSTATLKIHAVLLMREGV
ncbi:MAG TPA: helicase-related protein [Gemmatimonadaceae bacterium]|nr:helicase-related protein [Gemmatimonadaceae bacterium]